MNLNCFSLPRLRLSLLAFAMLALTLGMPAAHAETPAKPPVKKPKAKHGKTKAKPKAAVTPVKGEYANFASWTEARSFIDMMVEKHSFDRMELEALLNKTRFVDS